MPTKLNLIGLRFGRGIVTGKAPPHILPGGQTQRQSTLTCDCGTVFVAANRHLCSGAIVSCGCYGKERRRLSRLTHGHTIFNKRSRTYKAWCDMWQRCTNPNNSRFNCYGARGIRVCGRWCDFGKFLDDLGCCPKYLTLDRIDNDGNYEPSNCRWTTRREQRRNTQRSLVFTVKGVTGCLIQLCEHFNMTAHYKRVWTRIRRGWNPERALLTPIKAQTAPDTGD